MLYNRNEKVPEEGQKCFIFNSGTPMPAIFRDGKFLTIDNYEWTSEYWMSLTNDGESDTFKYLVSQFEGIESLRQRLCRLRDKVLFDTLKCSFYEIDSSNRILLRDIAEDYSEYEFHCYSAGEQVLKYFEAVDEGTASEKFPNHLLLSEDELSDWMRNKRIEYLYGETDQLKEKNNIDLEARNDL